MKNGMTALSVAHTGPVGTGRGKDCDENARAGGAQMALWYERIARIQIPETVALMRRD